jgi:cell wall-associated NlpC family hydrolase
MSKVIEKNISIQKLRRSAKRSIAMIICAVLCLSFTPELKAQNSGTGKTPTEKELKKERKAAKRQAKEEARRKRELAMLQDADYLDDSEAQKEEPVVVNIPSRERRVRTERARPEPKVKNEETPRVRDEKEIADYSASFAIETYAKSFQGVPYRMGGMDSKGFDCSGFTCSVFSHVDVPLPRTAQQQFDACESVSLRKADKGDLVFFGKSKNRISHVGLVLSEPGEDLTMIHSSSSQGIVITNVELSNYWKNKLVGVGRVPSAQK